ncbi:MAG: hypothetical protein M1383_00595 [Patescibacteria group bacterium]|nr:hypothetical protein [Patescibacteria group bacterium]
MITLLAIGQYLILAVTDIFDKFLISNRRVRAASYTFFTVVSGSVILLAWPWLYSSLPVSAILWNIFSGAWFSMAAYVFYKALEGGEVSRVVPFVYGTVPIFDLLLGWAFGRSLLTTGELAAAALLIPGALLISYKPREFSGRHIGLKILAALLISSYNLLWHFSSQSGPVFNGLMWNRVGAAGVLVLLLIIPLYRKNIFDFKTIEKRGNTSFLFIFKQMLGGGAFVLVSYLYALGPVAIIDSLQGFRYVFLFLASLFLSRHYRHVMEEDADWHAARLKLAAIALIFAGTLILFIK